MRELRRWTVVLERSYAWISCDKATAQHHARRQTTDTNSDPDSLVQTASVRETGANSEPEPAGNAPAWDRMSADEIARIPQHIRAIIEDVAPELLRPTRVSDPPGEDCTAVLDPETYDFDP